MKKTMKFLLVILFTFSFVFLGYKYVYKPDRVIEISTEDAFDLSNKDLLVGWADNVFIGTVIKKDKEVKDDISPVSTYKVQVEENIKGNLSGVVNVSQRIGYDNDKKALVKVKGDDYLINNNKYLFIAKYNEETKAYVIVPVHGNLKIRDAENEKTIKSDFQKAKENQKKPSGI